MFWLVLRHALCLSIFLPFSLSFYSFEVKTGYGIDFDGRAMFIDSSFNFYIADCVQNRVMKFDLTSNASSVVASDLSLPSGLWGVSNGILYIADTNHHRIATINSTGITQNFAGNGTRGYRGENSLAISALLNEPSAVLGDSSGNIYLSDTGNNLIRRVETGTRLISTVAGNFLATAPSNDIAATSTALSQPTSLWLDSTQSLYFVDSGDSRIRRVNGDTRVVSVVAGTGVAASCDYHTDNNIKQATAVKLITPLGLWGDTLSRLYFGSAGDFTVQRIDLSTGVLSVVVGQSCIPVTDSASFVFFSQSTVSTDVSLAEVKGLAYTHDSQGNMYFMDVLTQVDEAAYGGYYAYEQRKTLFTRVSVFHPNTVNTLFTIQSDESEYHYDYTAFIVFYYVLYVIGPLCCICCVCCGLCYCQRRGCYKYTAQKIFPGAPLPKTDVMFLHYWSTDKEDAVGLANHNRVLALNKQLSTENTTVCEMKDYTNIVDEKKLELMLKRIDNTKCVVIFVTAQYMNAVNCSGANQMEFEYAYRKLGCKNIVVVVMEEKMTDVTLWKGAIGGLANHDWTQVTESTTSALCDVIKQRIQATGCVASAVSAEEPLAETSIKEESADVELGKVTQFQTQRTTEDEVKSDVILIHDCCTSDSVGRSNHDRMLHINTELKKCGLMTWLDSEQLSGRVLHQLTSGVDGAKCAAVFVTESLMHKVNAEDGRESCQFAFNYALRVLGPQRVVAVVMEARMRDTKRWEGVFGGLMSGVTCVDLVQDPAEGATEAAFRKKIEKELRVRIEEKMKLSYV